MMRFFFAANIIIFSTLFASAPIESNENQDFEFNSEFQIIPKKLIRKKDLLNPDRIFNRNSAAKKPIVVVIPSYNNAGICEKNIGSILDQNYENYRMIYIDDCSSDETFNRVSAYIKKRGQEDKVTLLRNPVRRKKMANLYHAVNMCADDEIVSCWMVMIG